MILVITEAHHFYQLLLRIILYISKRHEEKMLVDNQYVFGSIR